MSIGPVEYAIVGFPGNRFNGDIVPGGQGQDPGHLTAVGTTLKTGGLLVGKQVRIELSVEAVRSWGA